MALLTLGLSHHSAPVAVRGRLAFAEADTSAALSRLASLGEVSESAILSTCNRTELTLVGEPECQHAVAQWWSRECRVPLSDIEPNLYTHRDYGSVLHQLRVASGLDSMVVGEPQILGQVKQSYAVAHGAQTLGPVLQRLFQHTFSVAKLVRSRTQVGAHPVSIAYAAVQLAGQIFADMRKQTALLVGAGETMQLLARHLQNQGVGRIVIANRSLEKAQQLAHDVGGYAIALDDLGAHLSEADLLVSSTAARGLVIDAAAMQRAMAKRRRKPVFMIDLAVPRDIDPALAELEDIYLYTIDDLRDVVTENMRHREQAARTAEVLIEAYAGEFTRWLDGRDAAVVIRQMREQAREHRDELLLKARRKLDAGSDPNDVMEMLAQGLTNRLLHAPSQALRNADAIEQALIVNGARRLFDLPDDSK